MVIAHELNALDFVQHGIKREALYYLLLSRARWFARRNAEWSGYKYAVPSQHKGAYDSLHVIGDKKGGASSLLLSRRPELLDLFVRAVDVPVHVVHVTRHPLDNISTYARKNQGGDFRAAVRHHFERCEAVQRARRNFPDRQWIDLALEDFIESPEPKLKALCEFLSVSAPSDYLRDCAEVVFDSPSETRGEVSWPNEQLEFVRQEAESYDFLERYQITLEQ
jgi:hypothetical protein